LISNERAFIATEIQQMSCLADKEKPKRRQFIQLDSVPPFEKTQELSIFFFFYGIRSD